MLLSCPNCQAEYDIPDEHFAQGARRVRCSNCSLEWEFRAPEIEQRAQDASAAVSSPQIDEPSHHEQVEVQAPEAPLRAAEPAQHDFDDRNFDKVPPGYDWGPDKFDTWNAKPGQLRAGTSLTAERPQPSGSSAGVSLFLVGLTAILLGAYFASSAVVSAIPASATLYRGIGLEPIETFRGWSACVRPPSDADETRLVSTIQVEMTNASKFGKLIPQVSQAPLGTALDDLSGSQSVRYLGPGESRVIPYAVQSDQELRVFLLDRAAGQSKQVFVC